jgi:hypothetical protein
MVAAEDRFAMSADEECFHFASPAKNYASECVRLAGLTDDEDLRNQLLEMARQWIAERDERRVIAFPSRRRRAYEHFPPKGPR